MKARNLNIPPKNMNINEKCSIIFEMSLSKCKTVYLLTIYF